MTDPTSPSLSLENQKLLDQLCDEFESAWKNETPPDIEAWLERFPSEYQQCLLLELIQLDAAEQSHRSQPADLVHYQNRFPSVRKQLAALPCFSSSASTDNECLTVDPLVGQAMGQYHVIEKLGGGGMGDVYRVSHQMIHCQRALKTLRPALASHPVALKRFLREAQASIRALAHPNLVTVFDVGQHDEIVFLVLELIEGVDLAKLVENEGPLTPKHAANITAQAAEGLHFAHGRGYVHRDVKPSNLMLADGDRVKILDLGLVRVLDETEIEIGAGQPDARPDWPDDSNYFDRTTMMLRSRLTGERALIGTAAYMAPEQARDPNSAGPQSDIYSLGCTLYYLLTGRHAFEGDSLEDTLRRHQRGDYEPLTAAENEFPTTLTEIVERMLAPDCDSRFQDAEEVQRALQQWLTGEAPRVRLQSKDLGEQLVEMGVVARDDWRKATEAAAESQPRWNQQSGERPMHAALVLRQLEAQHENADSSQNGLSPFQVHSILNEDADLLRLPEHVLLDHIGSGWKGNLYRARNLAAKREEVIRINPLQTLIGLGPLAQREATFHRRLEQLQSVSHPALVDILSGGCFDHRIDGRVAYMGSEFVSGRSLLNFVEACLKGNAAAPKYHWIATQAAQVAEGLHQLHRADLLHLDISPLSLRIDNQHRLRLTDHGAACLFREPPVPPARAARSPKRRTQWRASETTLGAATLETRAAASMGLPDIQAPELTENPRNPTAACDIYSLGCCLFFLFAGRFPFQDTHGKHDLVAALSTSPWDSPAAANVPDLFRPILDTMLAKQPHVRPQGDQLAERLRRLAEDATFPDQAHDVAGKSSDAKAAGWIARLRSLWAKR